MSTLKLKEENAIKAFNKGSESDKELLRNLYPDYNFHTCIMDRVKSIEDACKIFGINVCDVPEEEHIIVIIAAINESWVPDYDNSEEYKYRVWNIKNKSEWCFSRVDCHSGSNASSCLDIQSKVKTEYIGKNFRPEWTKYLDFTSQNLVERYKKK